MDKGMVAGMSGPRFDRYEMDKKTCCSCESPIEYSTESDFCQRCKKAIYIPTYRSIYEDKFKEVLKAYPENVQSVVMKLVKKIGLYCNDEHDLDCLRRIETILQELK